MLVLTLATSLALAAPAAEPAPVEAPEAPATTPVPAPPAAPAPPAPPAAPRFEAHQQIELGAVGNDIFGAAEFIHVGERVGDNAFLAGQSIHIEAPVEGDLFAGGESLRIDAPVHGDVYAMGESVIVGPSGRIDGHLFAGGGMVDVGGPVLGHVMAGAGTVKIGAPVSGDVNVEVGELVLEEGAHVGGDLVYTSPNEVPGAAASVDGQVQWTEGDPTAEEEGSWLGSLASWALWTGWSFFAQLVVGAVLLLLLGKSAPRVARLLVERPSMSLGVGVAGFILLPIVSVIAMALIIPLPLGVLGIAFFLLLLYVGQIVVAQAVGDLLLKRFRPEAVGRPVMSMAIGLIPVVLFTSLPWIGALIGLVSTLLGTGAIYLWLRELRTA